jgi:hypothetical protein
LNEPLSRFYKNIKVVNIMAVYFRTRFLLQALSIVSVLFMIGTAGAFETDSIGFYQFCAQAALFGCLSIFLQRLSKKRRCMFRRRKPAPMPVGKIAQSYSA